MVYADIETELSVPIWLTTIYDENHIEPHDRLYRCGLFEQVRFVMKTRQDNDVTNCTGMVYAENEIELSWPIRSNIDCDENHIGQLCD